MISSYLRALALAMGFVACASALAGSNHNVDVANDGYNRFTFDSPFKSVVLPPEAPVASKPVSLGGNTTLLVEFKPGITEPIQMVVQMADGDVLDLTLQPGADQGANWEQPAGPDGEQAVQRPEDKMLIRIFKAALANPDKAPSGFSRITTPEPGEIDGLTADYVAAYQSEVHKLFVMRLRAEQPSPILPQDIYVRGVQAAYIGGDAVGPDLAPLAVVLTRKNGG